MAQAQDTVWLPVLPSMKGFGPALVKGAGSEADKAGGSIGKRLGTGIAAGAAAAVATIGVLAKVGSVFSDVSSTISTGTGVAGADLEKLNGVAKRVGSTIPASFDTIANAVVAVQTSFGGFGNMTETEFDQATTNALNFSKRFEVDTARVTQVVGQMMKTGLVGNATEAFDLLTSAAQKVPAAVREDVLDAVDEYGPFFTQLGIKGSDAMGMLVAASEKGMYGIDKTGDALKEFTIRATDMSTATAGAYQALGMNQKDMTAALLAGGDTGSAAFQKIIKGLREMKDPVAQSQAALALFGTPLEDLGTKDIPKFIESLAGGQSALGDFGGSAARMGDDLNNSMGARLDVLKNKIMVWFEPLASKVLGGLISLFDTISQGATAFGAAFSDAGTEITSSGFVGVLETIGQGLGGIWALVSQGDYNGKLRGAFGWQEDHPFVVFLLAARDAIKELWSGLSMNADTRKEFSGQLDGWVRLGADLRGAFEKVIDIFKKTIDKIWEFREPIGIIAGLILVTLIPHFAALGVEALKSAAQQKLAWMISKGAAARAAFQHSWAVATMVGGWVLMGLQAMLNAGKIAASWLIAMGPVGWIILGIAGLVAAFIGAYENIGWFRDGVDAAMRWIGDAVGAAFSWIQSAIAGVVDWFTGTALPAWDAAVKSIGDFFNWLWTDVIKPVFDGIGAAINWVYESIIKPVFDGIAAAVAFVGGVFTGFYETTLKPIFDSAAVIIGGFYMFFEGVFNLVVAIIQQIVIPLFKMLWDRVVEAFTAMGSTINDWWNFAVGIFNGAVGFLHDVFAAVFTWLHDNVIKPVFDAISNTITWVWENVLKPTFDAWVNVFTVVIPRALTWLYQNAIKPVFDAIGQAVMWVWNNMISPTLNFWIDFFMNKIPAAARWLYENGIKPHFDNIGNAVKWVWENVLKPVFDTLSDVITKTIPKAFEDGVNFIKTAWDKVQDIAKAPVKFVIDTVINDGLIKGFNDLARPLGVKELGRVALPAGFADGGYTGPGGKYQPAGIVHAGEIVWSQDDIRRHGGVAAVENMRRGQAAIGSSVFGGIPSFVGPQFQAIDRADAVTIGGDAASKSRWFLEQAAQMWNGLANVRLLTGATQAGIPYVHSQETARLPFDPIPNWAGYYMGSQMYVNPALAGMSAIARRTVMAHEIGHALGLPHAMDTGAYSIMNYNTMYQANKPTPADAAALRSIYGAPGAGAVASPAGVPDNPLVNLFGGIIDGLLKKFRETFTNGGFVADLAIAVGKKILTSAGDFLAGKRAALAPDTAAEMPYLHDQGGVLHPGLSTVLNATRKPEAILNSQQWADIHQLAARGQAGGGGGDVVFNGNVGWDPHRVAQEIEAEKRRSQTMAGMNGVVFA